MPEEIDDLIEITDDDGTVIKCRLYDIIEFENKYYALLMEGEPNEESEPEIVLMRYIEDGEESLFEVIEDDEEFHRVSEYIDSLDEEFDTDEDEDNDEE